MSNYGNPLRSLAENPNKVAIDSSSLVIDNIYGVQDIIDLFVTREAPIPDPRMSYTQPGGSTRDIHVRKTPPDTGWISPQAIGGDDQDEDTIIRYRFDRDQLLNKVELDVLNVPCNWSMWFFDSNRNSMVQMTDVRGDKVGGQIDGKEINLRDVSKDLATLLTGRLTHKDYISYKKSLPRISTRLVEIRLDRRLPASLMPTYLRSAFRKPYALSIRNLRFHYVIRSGHPEDIPSDEDTIRFQHPLGFVERVVVTHWGARQAIDDDANSYWQCEPQALASSIVPYYLDVRDADGNAQTIDRLKMLPMAPGPTMNIYYTSDDAVREWYVSRDVRVIDVLGTATRADGIGLLVNADEEGATLSNDRIRLNPNNDWVMGVTMNPQDLTASGNRFLFEWAAGAARFGLSFDNADGRFKFIKDGDDVLAESSPVTVSEGEERAIVFGFNHADNTDPDYGAGFWFAYIDDENEVVAETVDLPDPEPVLTFPTQITLGNNTDLTEPAKAFVSRIWAKQDSFHGPTALAYLTNPHVFVRGEGPQDRTNGHYRTILRVTLLVSLNARVGPGEGYYDAKEWTPVPRDYVLKAGISYLPVIKAKYLKLEFSNLMPHPYPIYDKVVVKSRDYPSWVKDWYAQLDAAMPNTGVPYNIRTDIDLAPYENFFEPVQSGPRMADNRHPELQSYLSGRSQGPAYPAPTPTIYARGSGTPEMYADADNESDMDDADVAAALQAQHRRRRFFRTSVHEYVYYDIELVQNTAYFVGLRDLKVYRVDYVEPSDTPEYVEHFNDDKHIESMNLFTVNDLGVLISDDTDATFTSKTFHSLSKVRSVQFASFHTPWESQMSNGQMSLTTFDHLTDLANTVRTTVTDQMTGAGGGNQLQFNAGATSGPYGTKTNAGIFGYGPDAPGYDTADDVYDSDASYDDVFVLDTTEARTSVMARIFLPDTNLGDYELRLYAAPQGGGASALVASKHFTAPVHSWQEVELSYVTSSQDTDFQAEIRQNDGNIKEPFVLDFLGLFQNPVRFELSNDDGAHWVIVNRPVNNPNGYVTFPTADNRLKVRGTALRKGIGIAGYSLVPWYIGSPVVSRIPIDYDPPWGVSETDDLRSTSRKPFFQAWSRQFPQKYSISQGPGKVPLIGEGYHPA